MEMEIQTILPIVIESLSDVQQLVTFLLATVTELNRIHGPNPNQLPVTECSQALPQITNVEAAIQTINPISNDQTIAAKFNRIDDFSSSFLYSKV